LGRKKPIGIFDSGVGGLTVVNSLLRRLPGESFIYFGDTAHIPYGNKSKQQLMSYAEAIINFLIRQEVKAVLVACGTHSSVTLPLMANNYNIPMLGVVRAGARSAQRMSENLRIGVLATQATVNSRAYTREIQAINPECEVFEVACPKLVPLVENGKLDNEESRVAVREYITPLLDLEVDTLVLGCTHYPFLAPLIKDFTGDGVKVVDPSVETIEELNTILIRKDLYNNSGDQAVWQFYVSGDDRSFYDAGTMLLGDKIKTVKRAALD